jgi:hypothetical protein
MIKKTTKIEMNENINEKDIFELKNINWKIKNVWKN